ncbi:MAG: ABC transporter permease [Flavobacteriales bacterium]|nr:ABC transporter permease [Flavobacteriales bacterium]
MLLRLAYRNIWRNKRRTAITLMSVFFAVILSTLMMSMKEGMYARMMDSMIGAYSGFVQVQSAEYLPDRSLDDALMMSDGIDSSIMSTRHVTGWVPRIESFALAASDETTKGAMVVGIDPVAEKDHTDMAARVSDGAYLEPDDKAVLLGSGLAKKLGLAVGDTIVLIGMGYQGSTATGKYPVKGLVKFGSPELSKQLVILPLKEAQWFFGAEGMCTNIVVLMDNSDRSTKIVSDLSGSLPTGLVAHDWEVLMPDLKHMIETDRKEGYVFMFILYMVISFGIFGTMLMMLAERMHEFGVLVAVGMKRWRLAAVFWLEVVMLALLGSILGMIGALPVVSWFYYFPITFGEGEEFTKMFEEYGMEPVMQSTVDIGVFATQALVVAAITSVIALYPMMRLLRMKAIVAMRS